MAYCDPLILVSLPKLSPDGSVPDAYRELIHAAGAGVKTPDTWQGTAAEYIQQRFSMGDSSLFAAIYRKGNLGPVYRSTTIDRMLDLLALFPRCYSLTLAESVLYFGSDTQKKRLDVILERERRRREKMRCSYPDGLPHALQPGESLPDYYVMLLQDAAAELYVPKSWRYDRLEYLVRSLQDGKGWLLGQLYAFGYLGPRYQADTLDRLLEMMALFPASIDDSTCAPIYQHGTPEQQERLERLLMREWLVMGQNGVGESCFEMQPDALPLPA